MSVPGTFKSRPLLRRDERQLLRPAIDNLIRAGALHVEGWLVGECPVLVAREPMGDGYRWHLSISHRARYPTWDEIKTAAYGIECLRGVMLAQVLSPGDGSEWVNVHENCFHLYEVHDPALVMT